jgi:DNA-binding response OmpR family regulator
MKLLLIEDEKGLSDSILEYLRKEKYVCEASLTYEDAVEKIYLYKYDCIIVDINLPGGSGLDLIRALKENRSEAGIIIISARNALDDRITGLDIGADDYLVKPFHLSELNARVRSIIRRRAFSGSNEIVFSELRIQPEKMMVFVNDQPVTLTRKEFDLLLFFLSNKDRVLTKESIAEHLWGDEMDLADSFDFLYTHIKNLRKKLIEKGGQDYIRTVYGIGYKFLTTD